MSASFTGPVPVPAAQTKAINILITGASRGLGFGLVQQYAEAHNKNQVFAGVRSVDGTTSKALVSFAKTHTNVHIIPLDVSNDQSVVDSVSHVTKLVNHIDVIVNNAGHLGRPDGVKTTSADLVTTYRTNVVGPLLVVQSYLSLLQASSEAKVVNVSSAIGSNALSSKYAASGLYSYGTSKAALNYLNNLLSHAFPNILFLAIHPGWIDTDMASEATGGKQGATTVSDSVQAIRYYTAQKNIKNNQGEYLDIPTGNLIPY